ncbi:hypothetical protein [Nitratifractor sp.]
MWKKLLWWIAVLALIVFYPMLVSIYVTLPLFIGVAGYLVLRGIEEHRWSVLIAAVLYLLNLEINLSLPLLMTLLDVLLYYLLFFPTVQLLKRCPLCMAILSVVLIDLFYFGLILGYDFIFESHSIEVNSLLLYSLVMDIVVVVFL